MDRDERRHWLASLTVSTASQAQVATGVDLMQANMDKYRIRTDKLKTNASPCPARGCSQNTHYRMTALGAIEMLSALTISNEYRMRLTVQVGKAFLSKISPAPFTLGREKA